MLKGIVSGEEKDIKRIPMKGKNLYFKKIAGANISDSGAITTLTGFDLYVAKVEQGVNYSGNGYIYAFFETEPVIGSISFNDSRVVNSFINVASPINGFVAIRVSSTAQNVMCNTGSSVLPYEPYGYQEGWEVRDNQDRLIWGREDELQTATGTLPFKGYGLPLKVKSLLGNAVQNGTPAPDNIIMPEMCGVRTGNLFDYVSYFDSTFTNYNKYFDYADLQLSANTTYTLSTSYTEVGTNPRNTSFIVAKPSDTPMTASGGISSTSPITIATGSDGKLRLYKRIFGTSEHPTKSQFDNGEWLMLNLGSTALPYEPYGWKIPFENRGENLWDEEYPNISGTLRYIPLYVGEGSFTLSTTTPYDSSVANVFLLSGNVSSGASTSGNGAWLNHNVTAQSDSGYITIAYRHYTGTTSPADCKTMLNAGSTPKPYSPYLNETIPVYLGEVPTVRRVKKLVLTGEETWSIDGGKAGLYSATNASLGLSAPLQSYAYQLSSHFALADSYNTIFYNTGYFAIQTSRLIISHFAKSSVEDFKSFLQQQYQNGTPVTIWYVLNEPETTISNEPLCKISTYADELTTIQVHGLSAPLYGIGDYKDTLNLSTGVVTRKVKKLVLTGNENWALWSSGQPDVERYYYKWGKSTPSDYGLISTHLPFLKNDGNFEHIRLGGSSRDDFVIFISKTIASTVADFKAYLTQQYQNGTPVSVWYVLNTPETETVTVPTGMTGEIEGYLTQVSTPSPTNCSVPKWNGMEETGGTYAVTVYTPPEIPTTTGQNTLTVDTDLTPSSLTVKGHIKELT